ncbi:hypothetical protein ACE6H2_027060 [Prunus campanulata]
MEMIIEKISDFGHHIPISGSGSLKSWGAAWDDDGCSLDQTGGRSNRTINPKVGMWWLVMSLMMVVRRSWTHGGGGRARVFDGGGGL